MIRDLVLHTAILLSLVGAIFVLALRLDAAHGDLATEHSARLAAEETAAAEAAVRKTEQEQAARFALLDAQHQAELDDAKTSSDRVIADLRSGALKLRQRLATATANDSPEVAAGTGSSDESPGLRPADAGFLVRLADSCDADIRAAQAVIADDRRAMNGDAAAPTPEE